MIEFNGIKSTSLGVFVEKYPPRPVPQRKMERYSVPGRSGDVLFYEDAWENVKQKYEIYLSAERDGLPYVSAQVVRWLNAGGYAELSDEYDRDTFRLAAFTGPVDLQNTLNQFGRATIEFDCKPQRYLKSGQSFRPLRNGDVLVNPTGYRAAPLIRIPAFSGTVTISTNDYQFSFGPYAGPVMLDSEEKEAYNPDFATAVNLNALAVGGYPMLDPGVSEFAITKMGEAPIEIAPRWYEL